MIFGGLDIGSNVQEQIPGTFRSCRCKEYENDRGSSLLSAKVCETNEKVRKILRVAGDAQLARSQSITN